MKEQFQNIIKHLIGTPTDITPITNIDISSQFNPKNGNKTQNINAAFLIELSGKSHPLYQSAKDYLDDLESDPLVRYYQKMKKLINKEIESDNFAQKLDKLSQNITNADDEQIWDLFFPEACDILEDKSKAIDKLRKKRKISITKLNDNPIQNISKQILFTSNILLTLPPASKNIDELGFSPSLANKLKEISKEKQKYWYDHPIQMGVEIEKNEAVYGLVGLNEAIRFEKSRGVIESDAKVDCLLSVSVTHDGLSKIAKEYIEDELKKLKEIENLNIYIITEDESKRIIDEVLKPISNSSSQILYEIFGVDGEYGRHYSLLKAISAFWQVLVDDDKKATFKFDLDQVFDQDKLVNESGMSAFEHFKTPLWGAKGVDSSGEDVELGMIAGALVNQSDIQNSLFTPDVTFPTSKTKGSQFLFYSRLPQALSTQAEMMLRYENGSEYDGQHSCIHRIHVTGGTNGILIESLRKYRPFTPTFIGRAEDQAYILSVLFDKDGHLRYVHKDGLIMRHDKHAFAAESIEAAHIGKMVGDYVRILYFSHYIKALPWSDEKIKDLIDPFTGSFVSYMPFTVVTLRMALEVANLFEEGEEDEAVEFMKLGSKRVEEATDLLNSESNYLSDIYKREKSGWDEYYDILDHIEDGLKQEDPVMMSIKDKAKVIVESLKI